MNTDQAGSLRTESVQLNPRKSASSSPVCPIDHRVLCASARNSPVFIVWAISIGKTTAPMVRDDPGWRIRPVRDTVGLRSKQTAFIRLIGGIMIRKVFTAAVLAAALAAMCALRPGRRPRSRQGQQRPGLHRLAHRRLGWRNRRGAEPGPDPRHSHHHVQERHAPLPRAGRGARWWAPCSPGKASSGSRRSWRWSSGSCGTCPAARP